ncbi:hypothetical protein D3C80_1809510 [compost metagenome]
MQRNRQRNINHVAQLIQCRDNARRGERHASFGQAKTEIVQHDFHRRNDVGQVQQRLTHAHHHHIGDRTSARNFGRANDFRCAPDLADNFRNAQVAVKALLRR